MFDLRVRMMKMKMKERKRRQDEERFAYVCIFPPLPLVT